MGPTRNDSPESFPINVGPTVDEITMKGSDVNVGPTIESYVFLNERSELFNVGDGRGPTKKKKHKWPFGGSSTIEIMAMFTRR